MVAMVLFVLFRDRVSYTTLVFICVFSDLQFILITVCLAEGKEVWPVNIETEPVKAI